MLERWQFDIATDDNVIEEGTDAAESGTLTAYFPFVPFMEYTNRLGFRLWMHPIPNA